MKVSVSVGGRFHGFNMALYFQKIGILNQVITGYPKYIVSSYGIYKKHVLSIYLNEVINRLTNRLGFGYPLNYFACDVYDYITSKIIKKDSDVYFIWSGYALRTIKAIRQKNPNAKIILVRGSAHILAQRELLKSINKKMSEPIDKKMIAKELKEYKECDFITVPSTFAYDTFIEKGFHREKIFLNFLGVDLNEFPYKKIYNNDLNTITLGSIGTLSSRKNVKGLINVVAMLNQNYPNRYKLIIAGPIDHHTFDEKLLNEYQFIEYKGKLPQRALYNIYRQIDVFIINSIEEGLAMVQLQAMSCGCPLIATTNTGGTDIIRNYKNGIIIPINDEIALKKAITWFFENKNKIEEMGKESRKISENGFSWEDFGKRNIEFISKISKN